MTEKYLKHLFQIFVFWILAGLLWPQPAFAAAALDRTKHFIIYNDRYQKITYPMGDVNPRFGVCTDVIIRSYRKISIDFQQLIHETARDGTPSIVHNIGLGPKKKMPCSAIRSQDIIVIFQQKTPHKIRWT